MIRSVIGRTIGVMVSMMVLMMGLITVPTHAYADDSRTVSPNNSAFENRRNSQDNQNDSTMQKGTGNPSADNASRKPNMNEAITTGTVTIILFIIIALVLAQGSKSRYRSLTEESARKISQDARADNLRSDEKEDTLYHRVRDKHQAARTAQRQTVDNADTVNTASTVGTVNNADIASTVHIVDAANTVDNADTVNMVDSADDANPVDIVDNVDDDA